MLAGINKDYSRNINNPDSPPTFSPRQILTVRHHLSCFASPWEQTLPGIGQRHELMVSRIQPMMPIMCIEFITLQKQGCKLKGGKRCPYDIKLQTWHTNRMNEFYVRHSFRSQVIALKQGLSCKEESLLLCIILVHKVNMHIAIQRWHLLRCISLCRLITQLYEKSCKKSAAERAKKERQNE